MQLLQFLLCFVFVVFVAFSFIFRVFVVAGEYLRLALRRCGPLGARETGTGGRDIAFQGS